MKIDVDRQKEAQQKAKELLAQEEQKRAEQRLVKLMANLEEGNSEVLLNDELMEKLPGLIADYCQTSECDKAQILFEKLGECACSENKDLRERSVMALSLCFTGLDREQHPLLIIKVSRILLRWLRAETIFLPSCDSVCRQLQGVGIRMLEEGQWDECSKLLDVFYQIQCGTLKKSNAIRSVVCRAQDGMAVDYILEELTLVCLRGRGTRHRQAESILTHLGRIAATYLLDTLLASPEKEDRLRLLGIIPATGNVSVLVLKEYLQKKDLPWYAIRNIILMMTAMDDPELVHLMMPFLSHEDIRIQQQVLDCITEVIEQDIGAYLLEALPVVNDSLKGGLISYIGQLGEADACDAFLDLLAERESFSPEFRDDLLQKLVIHVRLSDSVRAVNLLTMIVEERSAEFDAETDTVIQVVNQSLQILKPRFNLDSSPDSEEKSEPEVTQLVNETSAEGVSFDGDPVNKNAAHQKVHSINQQVTELLGRSEVAEASQLLYKKCVAAAQEKDFETAEMLRDRILEVDPNALAEVIQAGETIEEERSSSITSSHISIWKDLYETLTTEEFNALYFALEEKDYPIGSVIMEQGAIRPVLFFVNAGQARLTCARDNAEIFLKRVGPGEIVGAVPFFDVSVWTVSLTALGKTNIHILEREKFDQLLDTFPGIEPCLQEYCTRTDTVTELLKMSGEDRRCSARYPLSLIVKHTLLESSGKTSTRSFNGEIADISNSGLSFNIRISRKENARLILGRGIETDLPVPGGLSVKCQGQIVAVRFQRYVESDYSVHVHFSEEIDDVIVKYISEM